MCNDNGGDDDDDDNSDDDGDACCELQVRGTVPATTYLYVTGNGNMNQVAKQD